MLDDYRVANGFGDTERSMTAWNVRSFYEERISSGELIVRSELVSYLEGLLVFEEKKWLHMAGKAEAVQEILDHINSKP